MAAAGDKPDAMKEASLPKEDKDKAKMDIADEDEEEEEVRRIVSCRVVSSCIVVSGLYFSLSLSAYSFGYACHPWLTP